MVVRDLIFRVLAVIIAAITASLVGPAMKQSIDELNERAALEEARSNHARAEGTWTPWEQLERRHKREMAALDAAEANHSAAEGIDRPPSRVMV